MSAMPIPIIAKRSLGWSVGLSIIMIIVGFLAIALPLAAGLAVNILIGWLFVFSGATHLAYAWHTRRSYSVIWEILLVVLYVFVGGYLLFHPLLGLVSLTLALALYLFAEAVLEFVIAFWIRRAPGWGWLLLDGGVTFILSVLIWRTWPADAEWAIGVLLGINLLFSGISRLMLSLAARRVLREAAV